MPEDVDQNDPKTPLEQVNPVPLDVTTDEAGEEPPESWGTQGQGGDKEDPVSEAVPQDGE